MKNILFLCLIGFVVTSCKPTTYLGSYGQSNETQVVLSEANFEVLGSFSGTAIAKRNDISIKNNTGIIARAKAEMLKNAKEAGVDLVGARALVNVSVDFIDNGKHISATVTADIIEFTKP